MRTITQEELRQKAIAALVEPIKAIGRAKQGGMFYNRQFEPRAGAPEVDLLTDPESPQLQFLRTAIPNWQPQEDVVAVKNRRGWSLRRLIRG